MSKRESHNTRRFCLMALNDYSLYLEGRRVARFKLDPAEWAARVADAEGEGCKVTKVAIRAALRALRGE